MSTMPALQKLVAEIDKGVWSIKAPDAAAGLRELLDYCAANDARLAKLEAAATAGGVAKPTDQLAKEAGAGVGRSGKS